MRFFLFTTLSIFCLSLSWAQAPATVPVNAEPKKQVAPASSSAIEKRTEHIRIEDAGSRIDELRIGGETKSIDVQPKGGMPAYQVEPTSGERSWKILGF